MKEFSELYLISALLAYGYKQVEVDRTNPRRQVYSFEDERKLVWTFSSGAVKQVELDLAEFESLFTANQIMLPPSYPSILKSLKYSIHSYRNDKR